MLTSFISQIDHALGPQGADPITVTLPNSADLPSCFAVTDLAVASIRAAAVELAHLTRARTASVDRRLAALWFDMTLRPHGWSLPNPWDAIAGVYPCRDGWIRLHTNAPHHRDAALRVLDCAATKPCVTTATQHWNRSNLEAAIVAQQGAAAALHSMTDWAAHPQGMAVAQEPLIAWTDHSAGHPPVALSGLKVLDLTRVLAGPVATRFLAGFGADVLRIDPAGWHEPAVEPEVTLGKRCATLNLTQTHDRQVFETLLMRADVLVHGYRPGALAGLGYDPERLHSLAPHLTCVSLSAYGSTGPWAQRRGFDSLVQFSCGIAAEGMVRTRAETPLSLPVQALDHATGYLMAAAVLRSLRHRNATGEVRSARLSLARTAALLTAVGARDLTGAAITETHADLAPATEHTAWGPAQRLRFPVTLDGAGPVWPHPAGTLGQHDPTWHHSP